MRRALPLALGVIAAALLGGCATATNLTSDERIGLIHRYTIGESDKYLRISFYATGFFGDASKRLLTGIPPEQVDLVEQPDGSWVYPGPVEKIIPVGTKARITKIEFPTAFTAAERIPYTPRTMCWVYVDLEHEPNSIPFVIVLGPRSQKNVASFIAELELFLTDVDPKIRMESWPEPVRLAVKDKHAKVNMTTEALEMAWGYPESKKYFFDGTTKREDWFYPGGLRTAHIADGRVATLEEKEYANSPPSTITR